MAHLPAFHELLTEEGIIEEVCFKTGETFDAAMSEVAWKRLKGAYEAMKRDHGADGEVIRDCRLIEDPSAAEEFTQMKGCIGAVVHPAGQMYVKNSLGPGKHQLTCFSSWPYKFVHALLRIVHETGLLNLQANTTVTGVSDRDVNGLLTVKTSRGNIRTKTIVHATNAWASSLLPEFGNLIFPGRGTLAAIKAPVGYIKHTGAQHWDNVVNVCP